MEKDKFIKVKERKSVETTTHRQVAIPLDDVRDYSIQFKTFYQTLIQPKAHKKYYTSHMPSRWNVDHDLKLTRHDPTSQPLGIGQPLMELTLGSAVHDSSHVGIKHSLHLIGWAAYWPRPCHCSSNSNYRNILTPLRGARPEGSWLLRLLSG